MAALPIVVTPVQCQPLCHAFEWTVADEPLLIRYVAQLAAGHFAVVRESLLQLSARAAAPTFPSAVEAAIRQLELSNTEDRRYHRDGWLFQFIAWIVAIQTAEAGDLIRAPHFYMTQQGIDGLLVHMAQDGSAVVGISICEQKASEQPRHKVVSEVWPGFSAYERNERDHQLLAEVTALLSSQGSLDALRLVDAVHWQSSKRYRAALTIAPSQRGPAGLAHLFAGYDEHVLGECERRRGEAFSVPALRTWMNDFAKAVIEALRRSVA